MALLAVTHFTPVVGLDVHQVVLPPAPPEPGVLLPHPHVGFVLDYQEYINAAKAVIGCLVMDFVQEEFASEIQEAEQYLEGKAAEALNSSAGQCAMGEADKIMNNKEVQLAMKAMEEKDKISNAVNNALGAGVGQGMGNQTPVFINGLMRTTAGTHTYHLPGMHFPLGAAWAGVDLKKPPSDDAESYMGSRTVLANGDPLSFMALPAMSCWFAGLEPPQHNSAHEERSHLSLPTSFMLPIPAGRPVLVGGPPTLNMAALAMSLFKAFRGRKKRKPTFDEDSPKPSSEDPTTNDGDPVNSVTGEVIMQQHDFTVRGRLPLCWNRYYESQDAYTSGIAGARWRTLADTGMELVQAQGEGQHGAALYFADSVALFDFLPQTEGWQHRVYDRKYGHAFYFKDQQHAVVRTSAGLEYGFDLSEDWREKTQVPGQGPSLPVKLSTVADLNGNAWHFEWANRWKRNEWLLRVREWQGDAPTQREVLCMGGEQPWRVGRIDLLDAQRMQHPLVRYEQDAQGDLVAVRDALDVPYCFEYAGGPHAGLHLMVRHTNRNGLSFYYTHQKHADGKWRVDHGWGDGGLYDYRFTYDLEYLETRFTNSLGHESVLQYDDRKLPISRIDGAGGVRSYEYDANQRLIAEVDGGGNATRWEYDERGNKVLETRADHSTLRAEYDNDGRAVRIIDPENGVWQQEWDERGNLVKQITPSGISTQYHYDDKGQLTEVTNAAGAVTKLAWDKAGNLQTLTDPQQGVTYLESDARGNVVRSQAPGEEPAIYFWDPKDRLTGYILPGRDPVKCTYSAEDELVRYTDEVGQQTAFGYYGQGRLASCTAPDGSVTRYHYDTEEQLTGVTNAVGRTWHLELDAAGRLIGERDYWSHTRHYGYDAAGRLARVEDGAGKITQVSCDRLGRIVQRSSAGEEERFIWNKRGQLTEARNAAGKVTRKYDADGNLAKETQCQEGFKGEIVNQFDVAGRLEKQQRIMQAGEVSHEQQLAYGYDVLGRMETVQLDDRDPVKLNRDEAGRLSWVEFGGGLEHRLSYDAAGQLTRHETRANKPLYTHTRYSYDALGQQVSKVDSRFGEDRYVYDPLGRIRQHTDPLGKVRQFMQNAHGDAILRESRTEDGGRVICHESGVNWRTDVAGQVVLRSGATNEDQALEWDGFGRLKSLKPRHGHWHYQYDALGRRLCKQNESNSDCTWFLWEGDRLAGEVQQTDGTESESQRVFQARFYVYHQGSFESLLMQDSGWHRKDDVLPQAKVYAYQNDPNGAPIRLCDGEGNTVWEGHYSVMGRVDYFGERTVQQNLRLQGQYFDDESGLHYNLHRYFDPLNGQFISLDPIGLLGGWNPYGFWFNTVGWIDPWGLWGRKHPKAHATDNDSGNKYTSGLKDGIWEKVLKEGQAIGWTPWPNKPGNFNAGSLDNGKEGSFFSSHAELKAIVSGATDISVDKEMCSVCQDFASKFAQNHNKDIKITDPVATRIFHANGSISTYFR